MILLIFRTTKIFQNKHANYLLNIKNGVSNTENEYKHFLFNILCMNLFLYEKFNVVRKRTYIFDIRTFIRMKNEKKK